MELVEFMKSHDVSLLSGLLYLKWEPITQVWVVMEVKFRAPTTLVYQTPSLAQALTYLQEKNK